MINYEFLLLFAMTLIIYNAGLPVPKETNHLILKDRIGYELAISASDARPLGAVTVAASLNVAAGENLAGITKLEQPRVSPQAFESFPFS